MHFFRVQKHVHNYLSAEVCSVYRQKTEWLVTHCSRRSNATQLEGKH